MSLAHTRRAHNRQASGRPLNICCRVAFLASVRAHDMQSGRCPVMLVVHHPTAAQTHSLWEVPSRMGMKLIRALMRDAASAAAAHSVLTCCTCLCGSLHHLGRACDIARFHNSCSSRSCTCLVRPLASLPDSCSTMYAFEDSAAICRPRHAGQLLANAGVWRGHCCRRRREPTVWVRCFWLP